MTDNKGGAPKHNTNAAKPGDDIRFEIFLSKYRTKFLQEYFELKFGTTPTLDELKDSARQLCYSAIDNAIAQEFDRHKPGRTHSSPGETL